MTAFEDFPAGSILSEMKVDIFASKRNGDINLFYAGELFKILTHFEYKPQTREFFFVFEETLRVPLGAYLTDDLAPYVAKADKVGVFQITLEGQPGEGRIVPLKII